MGHASNAGESRIGRISPLTAFELVRALLFLASLAAITVAVLEGP